VLGSGGRLCPGSVLVVHGCSIKRGSAACLATCTSSCAAQLCRCLCLICLVLCGSFGLYVFVADAWECVKCSWVASVARDALQAVAGFGSMSLWAFLECFSGDVLVDGFGRFMWCVVRLRQCSFRAVCFAVTCWSVGLKRLKLLELLNCHNYNYC